MNKAADFRKMRGIACAAGLLLPALLFAAPLRAQGPPPGPAGAMSGGLPDEAPAAGPSDAELGESAKAVGDLRAIRNKTLILVFDVSGSMKGPTMARAREAAVNLLREGTAPGDRAVLMTFGAGYRTVFDKTLASEADKRALVDQVPSRPEGGAGTNIRKPHHEALKMLEAGLPRPGAIILLTDSFNDEPKRDDAEYPTYLRYYLPGGTLTRYPDTPENRDYERLLAKLYRSRKVNIYGIGVQIDESGRPVERRPQAAPEIDETPAPPVSSAVRTVEKPDGGPPWGLIGGGLGIAALALGYLLLAPLSKSVAVRISGGSGGKKDFLLKHGQSIRLGGDGAGAAFDAYPLAGVKEAAAVVRGVRGGMVLAPQTNASGARVFHNGLPLEAEAPLAFGDELRVAVPEAATGLSKEFRLKFDDPKKEF